MAERYVSYGKCFLCGETFAKNTITRHLKKCLELHEAVEGQKVRLFHLRVEGYHAPDYWLHLEMPVTAELADLDVFLRDIWLECCGHLSAFTIDEVRYELDTGMLDSMWIDFFGTPHPTRTMDVQLQEVLAVGKTFIHEYDFGTTTVLKLKVVGEREGASPRGGVRLLARNYAPLILCVKCGKRARWWYVWGGEYEPYCPAHARVHEDWGEGFLPLVNSPRTGDCGYTGPESKKLKFEETAPAKE